MTDRETVAVKDAEGNLRWFPVADAQRWPGTTMDCGDMYFAAGRWLVLPTLADLTGEPARIVDDDQALEWFVRNGYAIPEALTDFADRVRLR